LLIILVTLYNLNLNDLISNHLVSQKLQWFPKSDKSTPAKKHFVEQLTARDGPNPTHDTKLPSKR